MAGSVITEEKMSFGFNRKMLAKDYLESRDGYATYKGKRYILVNGRAMRDVEIFPNFIAKRVINAVEENEECKACYYNMTLLFLSDGWKRGGEACYALPNGDYDAEMDEQNGIYTRRMGRNGARCHDE